MSVDPLRRACVCGYHWYFNRFDYIKMLLFGRITVVCPECGRVHEYILIYHAVEEWDNTPKLNKKIMKDKENVWRNP